MAPRRVVIVAKYPDLMSWREDQNLTQKEAAARLQMTIQEYQKYEWQRRSPRRARMAWIAKETGVSIAFLAGVAL